MLLFLLGILVGMLLMPLLWRFWLWADEWLLPARALQKYKVRKRKVILIDETTNNEK